MEENHSNADNFQLPLLKDMTEIISDFEKSGVTDEPLICNSFNQSKIDLQSGITKDDLNLGFQLEENGIKNNDEKAELGLLSEKDLSDIDFEISKDIFDEIKIREDDITGFVENVSSLIANDNQKYDINFKLPFFNENIVENSATSLNFEIEMGTEERADKNSTNGNDQTEMTFVESMEITFSPETESIVEGEKSEVYSNSNNEIKRIMTELQATSLIHKNVQDGNVGSKDNVSLNFTESCGKNSTDEENLKNLILDNGNTTSLTLESSKIRKNTDIGYNDSIQAAIESVIQASIQQDNETDFSKQEEINEKQDDKKRKLDFSSENDDCEKKTAYGVFDVVVPLIGKNVMKLENDAPFTHRYDLAIKRNEMRAKFQKNDPNFSIPTMSFEEWIKKKASRTKEEIAADERKKVINAIQLANSFTKIAVRILLEYEKDEPNEAAMIKFFRLFELAPASPLSLLYAPHFVHTMMLCRGDEDLSPNLRRAANECYDKCHALFPIPEGYNFETVYTSEVKKYVPSELDHLSDFVLDYGDYDSSDFEDDVSDCSSDSDKDWE